MKIAIASLGNPELMNTWSGIPAHIVNALTTKGHEVINIALRYPQEPWYYNWLRRRHYYFQHRWFLASVEEVLLKKICRQFDEAVSKTKPDVVLSIHGDWLSHITFKEPAFLIHDTTFATLIDYYPAFTNLTARSIRAGNDMYKRALQRAEAAIFSSTWASTSAINDYHTPTSKVYTIPLGANLTELPGTEDVNQWIAERQTNDVCKLLFIGIDWERKGGPDTLRFVVELNRLGVASHLTIIGCSPDIPEHLQPFVHCAGFLRKDIPSEAEQIKRLLIESHALILPSLAECYGCVYCEANAYGLPALGRDTGGVSEIIKESVNGLLLKIGESPETFASRWASIWHNRHQYTKLSLTSRREFDERLNYDVFITKLEDVIKSHYPSSLETNKAP